MTNFVNPEELLYFVKSIKPFQIKDIGSSQWLEVHEMVIKLSHQAILEASTHREECVKEYLISEEKLQTLVHEVFCILLWKTRVLPYLLEADGNAPANFLIYTVLFHEGVAVALLEAALFDAKGCMSLKDTSIDLIDYCAQGVAQVIGLVSTGFIETEKNKNFDESSITDLERQKRDLIFKIGMRCIPLLSYLADNMSSMPISASRRLIMHDVPRLMVDVLDIRPWQRKTKRGIETYIDEKWILTTADNRAQVNKHEVQAWLCLRQILFNKSLMESYEINEDRREHFKQCKGLLSEVLLDQVPPLIELKQFLCHMEVSHGPMRKSQSTLIVEELPQIRENLLKNADKFGGFYKISKYQENIFLNKDHGELMRAAQQLNGAYNTDLLSELEQSDISTQTNNSNNSEHKLCSICFETATKKCSKCLKEFYCSRKCQMEDWPKHKIICK